MISGIHDQGDCASSWAISTVQTAQDRLAITMARSPNINNGQAQKVDLSVQQLIECDKKRGQGGCSGGHIDKAWWYLRRKGLLNEQCYPTTRIGWKNEKSCQLTRAQEYDRVAISVCPSGEPDEGAVRYKMSPAYRIGPNVRVSFF